MQLIQLPEIQDQSRRDAEIDKIREAVEFCPEFRLTLDHARDTTVYAIEHRGEYDGRNSQLHPPLGGETDGRQSRADRQQGDDVGHQHTHRDRTKPAAAHFRIVRIGGHLHGGDKYSKSRRAAPLQLAPSG